MIDLDLNSNTIAINKTLAEIKRLQKSLDFYQDKFADMTQKAFIEGNVIKVTGLVTCNDMYTLI